MGIHNDSISTGLKPVSGPTVTKFESYYGGTGMTTRMQICSTCSRDYFSANAMRNVAPLQSTQPASSSSHRQQEEASGSRQINQTISTPESGSSLFVSPAAPSSSSQGSADSRIQPALLMEMPSYEREYISNERYTKLNSIAQMLNVTLPPIYKLKPYRESYRPAAEESVRRDILNAVDELFLSEHTIYEDQTIILDNIKTALADENLTNQERFRLIRLLPSGWSANKVASTLDVLPYTVYQAKKAPAENLDKRPVGNQPLTDEIKKKVIDFYLSSEISRTFPGKKDTISVKHPDKKRANIQKQLLLYTLEEIHDMFRAKNPDLPIGLTSFKSLRPKQCVFSGDSAAHNVCVCVYHENVKFCIKALHSIFTEYETWTMLQQELMRLAKCDNPSEACELQTCTNCDSRRMIEYVATKLDDLKIAGVSHKMWITTPNYIRIDVSSEVDTFLEYLKSQIESFIVHDYKVRKQNEFVEKTKRSLVSGEEVLIHCDFAENYTCIKQDAPQDALLNP